MIINNIENLTIGDFPTGKLNKITDVKGVRVGHTTIDNNDHKTGVTVVLPHEGNVYSDKLVAASYVINGFGKTIGLMQVEELGVLESVIALTNTLNVGLVADGLVSYTIDQCQQEGLELKTYNPIVCECNDSQLNKITHRVVGEKELLSAIDSADEDFAEGAVGAGRGMKCHGLKGGIGSSSRIINIDGNSYTLGVMVLSNHGRMEDLVIDGNNIGAEIAHKINNTPVPDQGSIIVIVATDMPVTHRQLKRIIKRSAVGFARLGSYIGHGSGELVLGFTTAEKIPHESSSQLLEFKVLREEKLESAFKAVADATQEAVLKSMLHSETTTGYMGNTIYSLKDFI